MTNHRKPAIGFIFITMLIDVMGWGLIIPVLPKLISQLKHIPVNEASTYGAALVSTYAIVQFVFSPIIGNLSDKYGRRPILLFSLLGFAIDYIFQALAPTYSLLFVGRLIAGITGASFTTGAAYIADISTPETRAKNFGMIGAAFGLGFVIGPALGGLLAGWGLRAPFYAAAILCFINLLYGYFVLPESLPKEHRRPFDWKKANPFGSLQFLRKTPAIGGFAICYFLIYLGAQAVQGNWSYYTMYRFDWKENLVGISLGVVGILVGFVQMVLTRKLNPIIGNEKSIYLGLAFYCIGLTLFGLASSTWMMFAFLIPYCFGGIAGPALQASITEHVNRSQQGALQGSLTSLMSLTTIIGPYIMTKSFKYFTTDKAPFILPGMPFFLGASFMLIALLVTLYIFKKEKMDKKIVLNN
ncbi:MAG: TCR/Tet family MFS transporter [Bacteroidetes bacterium]|nr:TCR/Tet family MFS transporter [Bacteroidota bacterium]